MLQLPDFTFRSATVADREEIYKIRHAVYAGELKQHGTNPARELRDSLDTYNHYIVAISEGKVAGFVSITPPGAGPFSVEKYFPRAAVPHPFDEYLFEARLLTVTNDYRKGPLALLLMYAAFRWVQSHGGQHVVSICRSDLLDMYRKAGYHSLGLSAASGEVTYELCVADIEELEHHVGEHRQRYEQLGRIVNWLLPFSFFAPSACYHGGAFFEAIGEDLQSLHKAGEIINADVLDAWFPPSPRVLAALSEHLPWLLQTSPPTHASGLIKVIAEERGVKPSAILHGAGSSDLIFLALTNLLNKNSRVLILDPCYGEYIHVLEQVIKCRVTQFALQREHGFKPDLALLLDEIQNGYDLVVLVNPNSPTGVHVPGKELEEMIRQVPVSTLFWIDETYIEYAGTAESLEQTAARSENVIVCKSMSKVYALSGARAAYLCCSPHLIETLKTLTPPWAVSLPAQAAAIMALKDKTYYAEKYAETHALREELKKQLHSLGITEIIEGVANFLLFYLPDEYQSSALLRECKAAGLFLRDVSNMGCTLGSNAIRIAVKDRQTNSKMIRIMEKALHLQAEVVE